MERGGESLDPGALHLELDLPEEVLGLIMHYLRDQPAVSLVSKRFHR